MTIQLARLLADGAFHSGSDLGGELGLGRAAVWKQVQALQARGLSIDAVRGKGYRIAGGLDLLSLEAIRDGLAPQAATLFPCIELFDLVDSTNVVAQVRVRELSLGAYVCLAEQQTAGRGRRGRQWQSPFARNIYLSVAWSFDGGVSLLQGLSLAVGVAVCESLESLGCGDVAVKWPNDIYFNDSKLGGILIEVMGDLGGSCTAVIGIGLNVVMPASVIADDVIDQPWTDLSSAGCAAGRNEIAAAILSALARTIPDFLSSGLSAVAPGFSRLDMLRGRDVLIHGPQDVIQGVAAGIDAGGALIVETATGPRSFLAGEVSVRRRT